VVAASAGGERVDVTAPTPGSGANAAEETYAKTPRPGPAAFDCGDRNVVWMNMETAEPDLRSPREIITALAASGWGRTQGLGPDREIELLSSPDELNWVVRDPREPSTGFAVALEKWGRGFGYREIQGCARQ